MTMKASNNKPIRLLHLPKTAGTTVASALLRANGRRNRFVFSTNHEENIAKIGAMSAEERASIKTFIGHSLFETGIPEADSARIVTYLREPVSRVMSFINYVASGRTAVALDSSVPFSIEEFLESGNPELSNLQTKIFINKDRLDSNSGIRELGSEAAIELAKKRLFDDVLAFGLQDRFEEGWVAIWHALGIRPPLYATMNQRPDRQKLKFTDAHIARIRELNELDIQLYEAASAEFERRIAIGIPPREVIEASRHRQSSAGGRFTWVWNLSRDTYYACKRFKRRILGQPVRKQSGGKPS
jgi:hypothetical protein